MEIGDILDAAQLPAMGVLAYLLIRQDNRTSELFTRLFNLIDKLTQRVEYIETAQGIVPKDEKHNRGE